MAIVPDPDGPTTPAADAAGPGSVRVRDGARVVVVVWVVLSRLAMAVIPEMVAVARRHRWEWLRRVVGRALGGRRVPGRHDWRPARHLPTRWPASVSMGHAGASGPGVSTGFEQGLWWSALASVAADGLIDAFIALGPTFVKLGQLMASAPGVFPAPLATAAERCLDAVPPFPAEQARRTIEEDLGRPARALFRSFEDVPLASASIGQVHACVLADGRQAVVKVQRPGIVDRMLSDLRIAGWLARQAERFQAARRLNPTGLVADMHQVTVGELDFVLEARHQRAFRANIEAFGDNAWVTAPEVYPELCGPRVICMERLWGVPVDEFAVLRERGLDGEMLMRRGLKVGLEAVCIHGPFQADTHAGNIWVLDDGRTAFLDFGITGELPGPWRAMVRDLFRTFMIDGNWARMVRNYKDLGVLGEDIGSDEEIGMLLKAATEPVLDAEAVAIDLAELFGTQLALARQMGASVPRELMLVAKQLFYFERYMKELAPGYALARDLFLIKNIWPAEAAARAAELGVVFPE
ncbi:MAG: AarF/UbiB family protein [Actinomycetota bacterium]|nr:AarF/UbiB family protein [Actinomycetota bacterium]